MRNILYTLIASSVLLTGCGNDKTVLYIYNWADYIDPEIVEEFKNENNCEIVIDTFDDNESAIAKLLAGGSGYDIMFPTSYAIPVLVKHDLIQRIDTNRIPNVMSNFDPKFNRFLLDSSMTYSVPYAFSITGVAYRKDKLPENYNLEHSWWSITNSVFEKRVCILNDIREILGIGLILNGSSINTTNKYEVERSVDTMKIFKSCARKLDCIQYRTGLVSGEFYVSMGYNSDILQVIQENDRSGIEFFIPDEGSTCCFDEIVILKNAKTELAYKFIDFLYRKEIAYRNSQYNCTYIPNKEIYDMLTDDEKKNPLINLDESVLNKLELIKDVGDNLTIYNDAWDRFISNKW